MINIKTSDINVPIIRGIVLAIMYLYITEANDMNIKNIFLFSILYLILIAAGKFFGIEQTVITGAFITKLVFTLVDDRVKNNELNLKMTPKKAKGE